MKILIATKNPSKIEGARRAFSRFFENVEIEGISVPSEVGEQPINDDTYLGAKNRVKNLRKYSKENSIDADYYVAIESGMINKLGSWLIINIAAIENKDGVESTGTGAGFPVPDKYVDEIIKEDLSKVMERIFNVKDARSRGGGIAMLTHGEISRYDLTDQAFSMALTKYINDDIWK